jgi:hypothetical protein
MADDASRKWELTDSQLLAYFNHHYPQDLPWKLVHPWPEMISSLTSTLLKQREMLMSVLNTPPTRTVTGAYGKPSVPYNEDLNNSKSRSKELMVEKEEE